ncbi:unnamed protein product [Arctia plantaginis]|uniref:Uncharacterized protein n=1 Tax=Arctia plantaginis TaxID=874455 RepID=A0A8S1AU58_ARCPL|nr:unnamed protein product [Arctia plantaginis]CAB3250304.1 unnamed protein product [Arctia plantaginis]
MGNDFLDTRPVLTRRTDGSWAERAAPLAAYVCVWRLARVPGACALYGVGGGVGVGVDVRGERALAEVYSGSGESGASTATTVVPPAARTFFR